MAWSTFENVVSDFQKQISKLVQRYKSAQNYGIKKNRRGDCEVDGSLLRYYARNNIQNHNLKVMLRPYYQWET